MLIPAFTMPEERLNNSTKMNLRINVKDDDCRLNAHIWGNCGTPVDHS